MVGMIALYDWLVQALVAAPLAVQIAVVLGVALPVCAVAALFLQRAVDAVTHWGYRLACPDDRANMSKEPPLDA